jgi:O-antigen/teichoic acid export membrane protein
LLWFLPGAVGFVLFPRVAARDGRDSAREAATLLRWSLLITAVGAAAIAGAAGVLVPLMYGAAFAPAVLPLQLLLFGAAANALFQVLSGYFLGRQLLKGIVLVTLGGIVLNVSLNLVLIPAAGIEGAAIASTVSYTATGLLTLALFVRTAGVSPREALWVPPSELSTGLRAAIAAVRQRGLRMEAAT